MGVTAVPLSTLANQTSSVKFEDSTRMSFTLPKGLKLPEIEVPVEVEEGEEPRTKTVVPSTGFGTFQVELQLGKDMSSGKSVPFIGYGALRVT